MTVRNEIIAISLCFGISFFGIRGFIYGVKRYQLNNSAFKKRKKGETFKEWLFYSRYKEEIPKALLILYFCVLLVHLVCLVLCVFINIIKKLSTIDEMLVILVLAFDCLWMLILSLLFWSPGPDFKYERWITKKRGQKPRNKR